MTIHESHTWGCDICGYSLDEEMIACEKCDGCFACCTCNKEKEKK